MIVKEFFVTRSDGVKLFKNYSDQNLMIRQVETGIVYSEAVDVENAPYTYEETDIPIEEQEEPEEPGDEATEADYIAALEEVGVNLNEES